MAYRIPSIHSKQQGSYRLYSPAEVRQQAYLEDMLSSGNPDPTYDEAFGPADSDERGVYDVDRDLPPAGEYESFNPDTDTDFKDTGERSPFAGPLTVRNIESPKSTEKVASAKKRKK